MGSFSIYLLVLGQEFDEKVRENPCSDGKDYTLEIESFRSLCGEVDADALKAFLGKVLASESDASPIVLSPDPDKSHRAVGFDNFHIFPFF